MEGKRLIEVARDKRERESESGGERERVVKEGMLSHTMPMLVSSESICHRSLPINHTHRAHIPQTMSGQDHVCEWIPQAA